MAEAAVSFLLESLSQLINQNISLISGAEKELKELEADLKELKAFLVDAAKIPNKPEGYKELERRIRNTVHEVEDTIDSCTSHAAASKNKFLRRVLNTNRATLAELVRSLRANKVIDMVKTTQHFAATVMGRASGSGISNDAPHLSYPAKVTKLIKATFYITIL